LPTGANFHEAVDEVDAAIAAMSDGDCGPYIALWSRSDDTTLFGAWGPIEQGHESLASTFRWVASRFGGGDLTPEHAVVHASGDLGYTVGFERGQVIVDGSEPRPMTIRVTHIYRREDGEWKLVHRHADFPPADSRG
jgi:ketosteroid isomerase-like protein